MRKLLIASVAVTMMGTLVGCGATSKTTETEPTTQVETVTMPEENTFLMPVGTPYTEVNPRDNKTFTLTIDFVNEYIGEFTDTENGPKDGFKPVEIDFTVVNEGKEELVLPNDVFLSLIDKATSKEYSRALTSASEATNELLATGTLAPGETKKFTKIIEIPQELSIYDCMIYLGATVGYITWDVENSITGGE